MSEYGQVKLGKLKLKGEGKSKKKSKKNKRKHDEEGGESSSSSTKAWNEETKKYHGWWPLKTFEDLGCGIVAVQTSFKNSYIFAVDNGTLRLGSEHDDHLEAIPMEEEIFTLIKISENKIAFKSGYGKYVSVNARGDVMARSEAVGPQEQIEVVIENEKIALQGHNGYFITINDEGEFKALSRTAKDKEIFTLRSNVSRNKKKKTLNEEEEAGDVRQFEINYVKQFQSFKNNKLKLHEGPSSSLEKARNKGKLHEAMLDRREKMKADRYCK